MSLEDQDIAERMFADHDIDVPYHPPAYDAGPPHEPASEDEDEFVDLMDEMHNISGRYVCILISQ
jgi:hypothetical protein